jgi:predicted dehydrogenase
MNSSDAEGCMASNTVGVALIGCGNIAEAYARDLVRRPGLELVGAADLIPERAEALAQEFDCRAYEDTDSLLNDQGIDIVVNLTIHHAHYEVSKQALMAGKHVHSEKPLTMSYPQAQDLVEIARSSNLLLGSSPFTYLGEAQQTAWKWIREGRLGPVRATYAEVNWGRIERWHPNPSHFYEVGPLFDVGVYPLAILTMIFGPALRVWCYGRTLKPDRKTKEGVAFHVESPDFIVLILEFDNGSVARLTSNFYVSQKSKQAGIEFHGDRGSLFLESWLMFDSAIGYAPFDGEYTSVPLVRPAPEEVLWARSIVDMAEAIREGRRHRATGEHAAHIVEILNKASLSMKTSQPQRLRSDFQQPEPMPWAK